MNRLLFIVCAHLVFQIAVCLLFGASWWFVAVAAVFVVVACVLDLRAGGSDA